MPVLMCRFGSEGRLAIVLRDPDAPRSFARARRLADERAGARARRLALAAYSSASADARVSVSHTEGSAAALAGPADRMIGVDLAAIARVTTRHAAAVLSEEDWTALEAIPSPLRRAMGWALKEAAAKATGAAQHYFPTRVRLVADDANGLPCAQLTGVEQTRFDSDCLVVGPLLCVVVRAQTRYRASALRECTPTLVKTRSP